MIKPSNNKTKKIRAGANETNTTEPPSTVPVEGSPINSTGSSTEPIQNSPVEDSSLPTDDFVPPTPSEAPQNPSEIISEKGQEDIPASIPLEEEKKEEEEKNEATAVGVIGTGAAIATAESASQVDQSTEIDDFRQKMADPANQTDYLFLNPNISTEPNKNKSYVRKGILHFTDSAGINAIRDTITNIGNLFGSKGIDNIIYDKLRNTVLTKVGIILGENRRCYNTTVQIERIDDNIFAHVYGTLYEKKSGMEES